MTAEPVSPKLEHENIRAKADVPRTRLKSKLIMTAKLPKIITKLVTWRFNFN